MILCSICNEDKDGIICDYCKFYIGKRNAKGDKICKLTKKRTDTCSCCKRFHCFLAERYPLNKKE
jgi:hypothetical protein